ncbi:MAG: hypothetical protein RIR90_1564, partial [Bacteroidota bacterium]
LIGDVASYTLVAVAKDAPSIDKAMESLLTENERVKRFGFTQSELDRAKKALLSNIETRYNEREKTNSRAFVGEYVNQFLKGSIATSIETEFKLHQELVPSIKLDEINALIKEWLKPTDRAVVIQAPEKDADKLKPADVYAGMLNTDFSKGLKAYEDKVAKGGMMPNKPVPGKIIGEKKIAELGVTEWTLSNGAKVVFKPTDFKNDEIQFSAISRGGSSLTPDADFITADNASQLVLVGGIGEMSYMEMQKEMTGKQVQVFPSIRNYSEGIGGSSTPKDFETAMQLLHLYFTAPRKDENMFNVIKMQINAIMANKNNNPQAVFSDTLEYVLGSYHPRTKPFEAAMASQMNLDKAMEIYKARFANAGDFLFTFVGNINPDQFRGYVETYIASLPSNGQKEEWKDLGIRYPKGYLEKKVFKGKEQKASVQLIYTGDAQYSDEESMQLDQTVKALNIKLREILREEKGGTYGTGASVDMRRVPVGSYKITIGWTCAPDKVEELVKAALNEIEKIKQNGATKDDVEKVIAEDTRGLENRVRENDYWLSNLEDKFYFGEDPTLILKDKETLKKLTPARTKELANKYFNNGNMIKALLLPENK